MGNGVASDGARAGAAGRAPGSDAGADTNGQLDPHAGVRVDALAVSLATSYTVPPWASTRIVPSAVGWALTVTPVPLGVGAPVQPEGATTACRTADSSECTPAAEGHS